MLKKVFNSILIALIINHFINNYIISKEQSNQKTILNMMLQKYLILITYKFQIFLMSANII